MRKRKGQQNGESREKNKWSRNLKQKLCNWLHLLGLRLRWVKISSSTHFPWLWGPIYSKSDVLLTLCVLRARAVQNKKGDFTPWLILSKSQQFGNSTMTVNPFSSEKPGQVFHKVLDSNSMYWIQTKTGAVQRKLKLPLWCSQPNTWSYITALIF